MIEKCPECGKLLLKKHVSADLFLKKYRFVKIRVYVCTGCDWMTVDDWDRSEETDVEWA